MKYLFYTLYQSGGAGLSNLIMSAEAGVILAHLTDRFLVIDGNTTPLANLVSYGDRVDNTRPSRVTDLIDLPVPWAEPGSVDLQSLESLELTDRHLSDVAFYFPRTLDLSSADARSFARGRDHWLTVSDELDRIPVLRLSEEPMTPGGERTQRRNLGFYSYLYYLDAATRRSVYRTLARMRPKPAFAELASRVAADIGSFNAVHLRRGDFKVTFGVTTLDRQPWEAIEALDQTFSRQDTLVILTDERDDPFFRDIKLAYPRHVFIDTHILDAYGAEFAALPQTDSVCLAYLSQLVAAESTDFIGTMTSTFTALIQRYRANRGKDEPFRFLWNELPEAGARTERGRHAFSDCVRLEAGVMVEESEGPYSWNRVDQRISPAWMREWPESFLTPDTLATGRLATVGTAGAGATSGRSGAIGGSVAYVTFENLSLAVRARDAATLRHAGLTATRRRAANVIGDIEITAAEGRYTVAQDGRDAGDAKTERTLCDLVMRTLVTRLARARPWHSWLRGAAFTRTNRMLVIAGDLGDDNDSLIEFLPQVGWTLVGEGAIAIRAKDFVVLPLSLSSRQSGAPTERSAEPTPVTHLVVSARQLHGPDTLEPLAPAAAVLALMRASLDFDVNHDKTVERLCRLVERQPVAQLSLSRADQASRLFLREKDRQRNP